MKIQEIDYSRSYQKLLNRNLKIDEVDKAIKSAHAVQTWSEDPLHPPPRLLIKTKLESGDEMFAVLDVNNISRGIWTCRTAFIPDREDYHERQEKRKYP